jgi:hypothetical protein
VSSRLFVAAKELSQLDRRFVAFYRMPKQFCLELRKTFGPFSGEDKDKNMR